MIRVTLDHEGRLRPSKQSRRSVRSRVHNARGLEVDWAPLLTLAGLDSASLQPVDPVWNSLATSDTRMAWTGTWPGSGRPLRVEAAALRGRPVAFALIGPWTTPWRTPSESQNRETVFLIVFFALAVAMLVGATLLVRKNMQAGRGDPRGAIRLAGFMTTVLLALWVCQVHLAATPGLLATFLISVCTSVFYGVFVWTIYIALEPFVRRQWPQTIVSWTTLLSGRIRDPIVGRDVLFGVAVGVSWALLIKSVEILDRRECNVVSGNDRRARGSARHGRHGPDENGVRDSELALLLLLPVPVPRPSP